MASFLDSQQTGTQNVTSTIDPELKQAYLNQISFANTLASRPYQQYGGPRVAGFSDDQQSAFRGIRDMQGQFAPFLSGAAGTLSGLMGAMPSQITAQTAGLGDLGNAAMAAGQGYSPTSSALASLGNAQGYGVQNAMSGALGNAAQMGAAGINRNNIQNVGAQNFLQGDVQRYMNPYTQNVIDSSMRDIDRARQLQRQQVNAQALSRGAFGGSRQAIAESENNRNYLDQQARTSAQLRSQGFDTAANLMQTDMNRALQADSQNQGMDFNTASQNAGFQQQANAQNQQAQNQFALSRYAQDADVSRFNAANQTAANQFLANNQNQFALSRFGAENQNNQFNAANANAASQFGANASNTVSLANQQAQNQFGLSRFGAQNQNNQFNAANNLTAQQSNANNFLQGNMQRVNAANQYANLGTLGQQLGLNQAQALAGFGGLQQQQTQRNYDTAYGDFQNQFAYPLQQLAIRQSALPGDPRAFGGNTATPIFENQAATLAGLFGAGSGVAKNLGVTGADIAGLGKSIYNSLPGLSSFLGGTGTFDPSKVLTQDQAQTILNDLGLS